MLAQWIGEIVGQMHNSKISKSQLAEHMGVSREYVSMILNGHRCLRNAKVSFRCNGRQGQRSFYDALRH